MVHATSSEHDLPIVCDPNALTADEMEHWVNDIVPKLYRSVQEIQELPNGYAFRLPNIPETLMILAEDLDLERRCCPFIRYTVEIEPNHGPFWLRMTGGEGVKEFLWMSFESSNVFGEAVAKAAGINLTNAKEIDSVETALDAVEQFNQRFAESSNTN